MGRLPETNHPERKAAPDPHNQELPRLLTPPLPQASVEEKEEAFWRIVERGEDVVEVHYGADLDTTEVGSGFPLPPAEGKEKDR